jgi:hypothetical protein
VIQHDHHGQSRGLARQAVAIRPNLNLTSWPSQSAISNQPMISTTAVACA